MKAQLALSADSKLGAPGARYAFEAAGVEFTNGDKTGGRLRKGRQHAWGQVI
jgi:hypothetical protein